MSRRPVVDFSPITLPEDQAALTVVIADADRRTGVMLRRPLQTAGYAVLIADTATEVLQIVYEQQPDILLLGSRVGNFPGQDLCRQIKADPARGFLPVILLADRKDEPHSPNGTGALAPDTVLEKPVNVAVLATWMGALLHLKSQYDRRLHLLADETRRLESLKSEIIDNISHELGTPLLQVKSAVALLAEDLHEIGTEQQRRLADMAAQALARLETHFNNIRQLAHAHNVQLAPILLIEAINAALRYIERSWTSRCDVSRVEVLVPDDLPAVVGEKQVLGRLLQILIDNALKFSEPDVPVQVIAEPLQDGSVWIAVRDFGIGIPAEERDLIFTPFYKVDSSSTQRTGGSGTGLALAVLLANSLNTVITLESEPGAGSTFAFTLPLARSGAAY